MTRHAPRALAIAVLTLVAAACDRGPSRSDVLADFVDESVVPAYAEFADTSAQLASATSTLCASPDEGGSAAVSAALATTRGAWYSTQAFWFGPTSEYRSWAVIDWPIRADEIDELLADTSITLDADYLGERVGADERGMSAFAYVLAGATDPGDLAGRRCDYLVAAADVVAAEAARISAGWTDSFDDGPAYPATVTDMPDDHVDMLVNDAVFLIDAIAGNRLGNDAATADDLDDRLAGLRSVLIGDDGEGGLAPLLDGDLVERIDAALATAASGDVTDLEVIVATEVVSDLGVTIGFSDADGDSGG